MIKMKALKSFGFTGTNEGHVRRGTEFTVGSEQRMKELESHGLAYPLVIQNDMVDPPVKAGAQPPAENKAAHTGPLPLAGGETGGEKPQSSSPPDHQRRGRRSRSLKGALGL